MLRAMPTIDDLCAMLTSPDPVVRDQTGYSGFTQRVGAGAADGDLRRIGDRMADQHRHPEIQARTFAALGLAMVMIRDEATAELDAESVLRWRDVFAAWWSRETDLRGYDDSLGWLHAIAHGADTVEAFGRSRHLDAAELVVLLDLVRQRLLTPTDHLFADGEDDRVASALAVLLPRAELSEAQATEWLTPIRDALQAVRIHGTFPAWLANTVRTLNSLYVAIHRGVRFYDPGASRPVVPTSAPHRDAILAAIAECLRVPNGYIG